MEQEQLPPKGKYAQLLASFKVGEQRKYDKRKGTYIRQAISKLGVSDQFTSWGIYNGDELTNEIVVHRVV